MKIAIIGSAHPLRGGGIATFNERMAYALQEEGHQVAIYSFSLQYPNFLFPGKSQFTDEPAPKGLKIHSIINSINPLNWLSVGRRIKKEKPDLVIVRYWLPFMGPCLGTILRIVRKNKHTRILCIADNVIPHEKRPGDVQFTKYFIKPVDAFITMSRDVLKDLQTFTNKPSLYTPHPLYDNYGDAVPMAEARKKLNLDPHGRYLLFFGFIRKYKGLDILLEAMNDERIKAAGIELIIAGEYYEDKAPYEQQMADYGLKSLHLFTDFIPNDEVKYYFSAADLVTLPYRDATQSGITQVAYHFEKPMIVTNVGGIAEGVPDGKVGYIAAPDAKSVADNILKFFTPGAIPNLHENIIQEKQKYSWGVFLERLFKTINL
ncbi:glycosyltransferase [Taibaiella soli]|uniref:Glycosyl transferase family 1 n=1 Tax=Taibaiella soli TaxID=1649169 RepID=A0A2W2BZ92_9BACT|nr:glycosyltransferase [Taibaiella soli]PZF73163.1 glycosyl transferase family 1 [Taibaiella soli]